MYLDGCYPILRNVENEKTCLKVTNIENNIIPPTNINIISPNSDLSYCETLPERIRKSEKQCSKDLSDEVVKDILGIDEVKSRNNQKKNNNNLKNINYRIK